jgi:hypothetical protein
MEHTLEGEPTHRFITQCLECAFHNRFIILLFFLFFPPYHVVKSSLLKVECFVLPFRTRSWARRTVNGCTHDSDVLRM